MGCLRYDILGCLLRNCIVSLLWIRPTDPADKYSRAWKQLDRPTPKGYEVELVGAWLTQQAAESNRALHSATSDLVGTAVRHWPSCTLSWTRSLADLCWYLLRPTRTNGRCLLWLLRDLRPT